MLIKERYILFYKHYLPLIIFMIISSSWLAYAHIIKSYHIWSPSEFINFKVGLPFNARFLLYSLSGFLLKVFNLSIYDKNIKILLFLWDFLSIFIVQILLYKLIYSLTNNNVISILSIVVLLYLVSFHFVITPIHNYYYLYDYAAMAFFMIFVYSVIKNHKFYVLILILVLGTLNRETTFLMPLVYFAINYKPSNIQNLVIKFFILIIFWIITKIFITYLMIIKGVQGDIFSLYDTEGFRLIRNLKILFFLLPINSVAFYSSFGFLYLFLFKWLSSDNKYFNFIYVYFIYLSLMMFVGNIDEIRIFGEMIILFVILFTTSLKEYINK